MRRSVYGRRNNGDHGLFVSQAGGDAYTITDDRLLAFSTNMPHGAVVHAKGTATLQGSGTTTISFPALPYIPQAIVGYYDTVNSRYYFMQPFTSAYYVYNGAGSQGSFSYARGFGPRAMLTASSIIIEGSNGVLPPSWVAHYTVIRAPGGS